LQGLLALTVDIAKKIHRHHRSFGRTGFASDSLAYI